MPETVWTVYLLRCADDTLYCGVTTDLARRLTEHNKGTASKYTRARRPVTVAASRAVGGKGEALRLEMAIKKQPRAAKVDFLNRCAET